MWIIDRLTDWLNNEDALDAPPPYDEDDDFDEDEENEPGKAHSSTVLPRLSTSNRLDAIAWWERVKPTPPVVPSVHLKGKDAALARKISLCVHTQSLPIPDLTPGYAALLSKITRNKLTTEALADLCASASDLPLREVFDTLDKDLPPQGATAADWLPVLEDAHKSRVVTGLLNQLLQRTLLALCPDNADMLGDEYDHGVASAVAATYLGQKLGLHRPYLAYLTALFHDIGKAVAHAVLQDCAAKASHTLDETVAQMLRKTYHEELGLSLARAWKLPDAVAQVIGNHEGKLEKDDKLVGFRALIQLGDEVAMRCGHAAGETSHHGKRILDCAACRALHISAKNAKKYFDHLPTLMVESTL